LVSSSQIREQIARYVDRKITLDRFYSWFIQNTWDIHKSGSVAAESLTFSIADIFSDYAGSRLSAKELRNMLLQLLEADNRHIEITDVRYDIWAFKSAVPVMTVSLVV
jgi:hypothetical protein